MHRTICFLAIFMLLILFFDGFKYVCDDNFQNCPFWTVWGAFGQCGVSCGGGIQARERQCIGGIPGQNGCLGSTEESETCNTAVSNSFAVF